MIIYGYKKEIVNLLIKANIDPNRFYNDVDREFNTSQKKIANILKRSDSDQSYEKLENLKYRTFSPSSINYSPETLEIMQQALVEAQKLPHAKLINVDPDHFLLAFLAKPGEICNILAKYGITYSKARKIIIDSSS